MGCETSPCIIVLREFSYFAFSSFKIQSPKCCGRQVLTNYCINISLLREDNPGIQIRLRVKENMDSNVDSSSAVSQKLLEQNEDMIGAIGEPTYNTNFVG